MIKLTAAKRLQRKAHSARTKKAIENEIGKILKRGTK